MRSSFFTRFLLFLVSLSASLAVKPPWLLFSYSCPLGSSMLWPLAPSSPSSASFLLQQPTSPAFTYVQVDADSKVLHQQQDSLLPAVFSASYFRDVEVWSRGDNGNRTVLRIEIGVEPRATQLVGSDQDIEAGEGGPARVWVVEGNLGIGVARDGKGMIWDFGKKEVIRMSTFNEKLDTKRCGYIFFMESFVCKVGAHQYREIPLYIDIAPIFYYNFDGTKPYSYKNNTILGCHGDSMNLYCEFYNYKDNSSALLTIEGISPLNYLGGFESSYLPIPELSLVAVGLSNSTLGFYNLADCGNLVYLYSPASHSSFFNPVFSNTSFLMSIQTSMTTALIFKFEAPEKPQGCYFYSFLSMQCLDSTEPKIELEDLQINYSRYYGNGELTGNVETNLTKATVLLKGADFSQFEQDKNLVVYSLDLRDYQEYFEIETDTWTDAIEIRLKYLKSTPESVVKILLKDIILSKEISNQTRNLQGYLDKALEFSLPAVAVHTNLDWFLNVEVYYYSRGVEICLTIFLLLRSIIPPWRREFETLWLFRIIFFLQALSLVSFYSVYFYKWFDKLTGMLYYAFHRGFLNIEDYTPFDKLAELSYSTYIGKVSEMEFDYQIVNKNWTEILLYFVFAITSLISSISSRFTAISGLRITIGLCTFLPNLTYTILSIICQTSIGSVEWIGVASTSLGVLTVGIQFIDFILSYNSPGFSRSSYSSNLYPKSTSVFYIFGTYIFKDMRAIRSRLTLIQFTSLIQLFYYPSMIVIFTCAQLLPLPSSYFLLFHSFWSSFMLLSLLILGGYSSVLLAIFSIFEVGLWIVLSVFFAICENCLFLSLEDIEWISEAGSKAYFIGIIFAAFSGTLALFLIVICSISPSFNLHKFVIPINAPHSEAEKWGLLENGFIETKREKEIREKVKKLNPREFWEFVNMNTNPPLSEEKSAKYTATRKKDLDSTPRFEDQIEKDLLILDKLILESKPPLTSRSIPEGKKEIQATNNLGFLDSIKEEHESSNSKKQ